MNSPVDIRRLGFVRNVSDDHSAASRGQANFLEIAARYLHLALDDEMSGDESLSDEGLSDDGLSDDGLSDDEELVHEALDEIPEEAQGTPAAAALSRYRSTAQTSVGKPTTEERQLINELADTAPDTRQQLKDKLGEAVDPAWVDQLPDEQVQGLLQCDGRVIQALLNAGMPVADVIRLAPTIDPQEVSKSSLTAVLSEMLPQSASSDDALLWARYKGLAADLELASPLFRADVTEARYLHPEQSLEQHVHYARSLALYRQLGALIPLETIQNQPPQVVHKLLAQDPEMVRALTERGLELPTIAGATPDQSLSLLRGNAEVVQALLDAGMSVEDVNTYASTLSLDEVKSPKFVEVLRNQLESGASAAQAITCARFSPLASREELVDPQFVQALMEAPAKGFGQSPEASLFYARADLLVRRLDGAVALEDVLELDGQAIDSMLATDAAQIKEFLGLGLSITQVAQASPEQREAILAADPTVVKGLLGAGMSVEDTIGHTKDVTPEEAKSAEFTKVLHDKLNAGVSAADAIIWARFSPSASQERLSDPDFIKALEQTPEKYSGSIKSQLHYARADLLVRRLDGKVSVEEALKLEGPDINALLKQKPEVIAALLEAGLDLKAIATTPEVQVQSLAKLDPEVVKALIDAGMKVVDVASNAAGVTAKEAQSPAFVQVLKDKIDAGVPAADAIIWARFSPSASKKELSDPDFIKALAQTPEKYSESAKSRLNYARADLLVRRLDKAVIIDEVLQLDGDNINRLLTQDASLLKSLLAQGRSLKELSELTPEQLAVFKSVSPELLTWLHGLGGVTDAEIAKLTSDEVKILQAARDAGFRRPEPDTVVHDILPETVSKPIVLGEGLVTLKTEDGSQIIVTKAHNPALYNQALGLITERAQQQVDEVRQKNGLPTGAEADVMESPSDVLSNSEDPNSAHLSVGELSTKTLLDRLHGYQMKPGEATVENNQVVYRLNDGTELRIDKNQLQTDRAKHTLDMLMAGQAVSEEELAHLESDEGSQDIFEGDDWDTWMKFAERVPDSSPRAQLARALEAKNALANGYDLLPYYEASRGIFGTYRTYPGGEENPTMQTMSPADVAAVINEGEINNRVLSLMQDPTVQADYQVALSDSVNSLPNKKELADKLFNALTGPAYIDALRALKDKNLSYEAEQMTQQDLSALAMLDPARALEAAQQLRINSMGADFQALVDDPSQIDVETFDAAMMDSMVIAAQVARSTAGLVRHGSQSAMDISKFIEESLKDKKSVTELSKVVRELVIEMKKTGVPGDLGSVTQAQFEEAMAKTHVPLEMRGKLTGFLTKAQGFGVWGSISGAAAAASFGYRLSQGAWGPDSTPMERWGAARDLLSFVSVGSHVAKAGAGSVDFVLNKLLGPGEDGERAWKALGLDRTLPELWGKKSFLPSQQAAATDPLRQPLIAEARDRATNDLWNSYDSSASRGSGGAPDRAGAQAASAADNLGTIWAAKPELKPLGNVATRVGLSAFKALCVVADVAAGVGDIVVSALGLKNAIKEGDAGMIAVNSVGIAGGTALTAAGGIGTAGLFATLPALVATAVAPLFVVGTVLAFGTFLATMILGLVRRHNQLQHASDEQGDWFGKLANDGLAHGDWGDKLEYLRYAFSWYGNDNTDPNKSYFEFQQAEWDHFNSTPPEDGSSVNRLNSDLHVRTDKTWETPEERKENEPDDSLGGMS